MNKIGIIGGAGPMASSLLYNILIDKYYEKLKYPHLFPELVILNFPFVPGRKLTEYKKNGDTLIEDLQQCFDTLHKAGCNYVALACNTLHSFLDYIDLYDMVFINLIDEVRKVIEKEEYNSILLLATSATIKQQLYKGSYEIRQVSYSNQAVLDNCIEHILNNSFTMDTYRILLEMVQHKQVYEKSDVVVLGCTDLTYVHKYNFKIDIDVPCIDSISVLAEALVSLL